MGGTTDASETGILLPGGWTEYKEQQSLPRWRQQVVVMFSISKYGRLILKFWKHTSQVIIQLHSLTLFQMFSLKHHTIWYHFVLLLKLLEMIYRMINIFDLLMWQVYNTSIILNSISKSLLKYSVLLCTPHCIWSLKFWRNRSFEQLNELFMWLVLCFVYDIV